MMQRELTMAAPRRPVRIFGVADAASAGNVTGLTNMRTLPVLQDTPAMNVAMSWRTTQRDVVILDAQNRRIGVYNLSEHNLAEPANYMALRTMLLEAGNRP